VSHLAQGERRELADELLRVGPSAPTLCEGWTAADLAAHIVVRERRPGAALGLVVPPLAGHLEHVQHKVRDGHSWEDLVATVRKGPPFPLRVGFIDEPMNTAEFFVHLEDVRRAQPGWEPRGLSSELEQSLWGRVRLMARGLGKRAPTGLVFSAPGIGEIVVKKAEPSVTVEGPPSELLLVAFGRQKEAAVRWSGDSEAIEQVKAARFGI